MTAGIQATGEPLSVARLLAVLKDAVSAPFGLEGAWVEGEVTEVNVWNSGHCYFTLRDTDPSTKATLSCVMWKGTLARAGGPPAQGDTVLVHGMPDVYAPRGSLSFIADRWEAVGLGAQRAVLDSLREAMTQEGLLAEERKRPLPLLPARIGVVTAAGSDAWADFRRTAHARWPRADLLLAAVRLTGIGAAEGIARAIDVVAQAGTGVEVVAIVRGGGSEEDLWTFNLEPVARAIAACRVPVVVGVGHELDVSLADQVADLRAKTPTEAAVFAVPDEAGLRESLAGSAASLGRAVRAAVDVRAARVASLAARPALRRPADLLVQPALAADDLARRATEALRRLAERGRERVGAAGRSLAGLSPSAAVAARAERAVGLGSRLGTAASRLLERGQQRVAGTSGRLEAVSPLAVLARGYSVTTTATDDTALHEASQAAPGDLVETRLHRGRLVSRVESVETDGAGDG